MGADAGEEKARLEAEAAKHKAAEDADRATKDANAKEEQGKVDSATALIGAPSPAPAPNADDSSLTPEVGSSTTLQGAVPAQGKNPNAMGDLQPPGKGTSFWELFWAVVYVLANPHTTWEFLPDRAKKPLIAVASTLYKATDKLVITPTGFLVNNVVVKPVDFVVNKVLVGPLGYAANKLIVAPINLVTDAVSNVVGKMADKVEEKVVDPMAAKKDRVVGAVTEKVDDAKDRVVDAVAEKFDSAKEGAGAAFSRAARKVVQLFTKQNANSPPKPGDNNLLPEYNSMNAQRGSVSGSAPAVNAAPDPNAPDPKAAGPKVL